MKTLLDRDSELTQLLRLLDDVRTGRGHVVVIDGPPGIGKTALLSELCGVAEASGFQTMRARGGEFEREFAFGVARQLLERVVITQGGATSDPMRGPAGLAESMLTPKGGAKPANDFEVFHSLYWLCANLAEKTGVVLAVDDAHWADTTSLEWLRYLTRRVEEIPVLVAMTVRSDQASTASMVLQDIVQRTSSVELSLPPLTAESTGVLFERVLCSPPEPSFIDAGHRATGGNPFLVTELARAMLEDGIKPRGAEAWRIGSLRAQSIVRSIDGRLRRLSGAAQSLAQAAAVFGLEAEFRHAASLAGLDLDEAVAAADELHRAWIVSAVDPVRFEHSVTRDAVLAELSPARLARDHKRAADALAAEKAPADRVAGHLLLATPVGDPGSARWLRAAADLALRGGAPASAIVYLERALIEPPAEGDRWSVLRALARAELLSARHGAIEHLEEALENCDDPAERPLVAAELARALSAAGRVREAYRLLEAVVTEAEPVDRELALMLEAELLAIAQFSHDVAGWARQRAAARSTLAGATVGERAVLANVAYIRSNDGTAHDEVLAIARRAFGDGKDLDIRDSDGPGFGWLARVFMNLGELDPGEVILRHTMENARARGSVTGFAFSLLVRAALSYTVGNIAATADDSEAALRLMHEAGWRPGVPPTAALCVAAHVELGNLDDAVALLEGIGLDGPVPALGVLDQLLYFRGVLRGERGEIEAAIADFRELGAREATAGYHYMVTQWRAAIAPLLAAGGREAEARQLVEDELAVARRRGSPKPLAVALRARAAVEGGDARVDLLTQSCALLEPTPFRLEMARAAVDLGAALRRSNQRREGRAQLERGLDMATRCGAVVLAARAQAELAASGARPRRAVVSGPESLTPSERRVAEMAGEGMSNPQIAQALFVTRKTVETHLRHAYQKLAITNRAELPSALAAVSSA